MCGILGIVEFKGSRLGEATVLAMRDSMMHRGPDDAGVFLNGNVALAHRRLSIIDLSEAGHQPMSNEDGSLWLVFNGEIYNYVELAAELKQKGHIFRSNTDSEVILHLYEEEGEKSLKKLNGMFSFAIWNQRERELFAARDRLGIKPFYYYLGADRLVFASEIKAIIADGGIPRVADDQGIADYFFCGLSLAGKTMFKNIRQLEPGHFLKLKEGRIQVTKYWDICFNYKSDRQEGELLGELSCLLEDSVRIQCRSDAPLGCHLSGGIDSSIVVAFASRFRKKVKTFTIKFEGNPYYDETPFARSVAAKVGAEYFEETPGAKDFSETLPRLIWYNDGPLMNIGAFSYHTVSKAASQHVKVTLTGHGGDEVFAGYPAQFQATFGSAEMFEAASGNLERMGAWSRLGRLFYLNGFSGILRKVLSRVRRRKAGFEEIWTRLHCNPLPRNNPLLNRSFVKSLDGYSPEYDYVRPLQSAATDDALDRCLYHDIRVYLPGLLHMEDRASMACSIESRVPLLDHRIVEFAATVPARQKIGKGEAKWLLRQVGAPLLPKKVIGRKDKSPFPVPVSEWFSGELAGFLKEVLFSEASRERKVLNHDYLSSKYVDRGDLWSAVNVELWHRLFIDNDFTWMQGAHDRLFVDCIHPINS
jgi:asparagine synthase (glutamine-hydrolysing)